MHTIKLPFHHVSAHHVAPCVTASHVIGRFSPDQDALFVDFPDLKENFSFYDSSGLAYSVPFTPNIVQPQWGHEYYYSGSGYALSFACASNQTMSSACKAQQKNGYVTCNCSQSFQDLMPPPTAAADGSSSTFLDSSTRALDVSFLLFSPSLQSYMFLHLLFEFSETGTVTVWDDYVTFSGRYSKQFSSEKLTVLRVSQYVTIVYALMYLIYEWEDWKVLRARIPAVSQCICLVEIVCDTPIDVTQPDAEPGPLEIAAACEELEYIQKKGCGSCAVDSGSLGLFSAVLGVAASQTLLPPSAFLQQKRVLRGDIPAA